MSILRPLRPVLFLALVLVWSAGPLAADEPVRKALTIAVRGKALDVAALRAREAEVRAELAKIKATPTADAAARKLLTEPRESVAAALKHAAELMEMIAGAPTAAAELKAKIGSARAELTALQERESRKIARDTPLDDDVLRSLEARAAKAGQDLKDLKESVQKLAEAVKKRQGELDGHEARQAGFKSRAEKLAAELEKTGEDAVQQRDILALQLETNEVREGISDLLKAHHVVLLELDTLRYDLVLVEAEVAGTERAIADAALAKARALREAQLEAEAQRRKLETQRKLREAELASSPSVKATKWLEALIGSLEANRAEDRKKISVLKAQLDEARATAFRVATRVKSIELLYPKGTALEAWQREGLAEQMRQQDKDLAEFQAFQTESVPDLNELLAQTLTKAGRVEIFDHRLNAAQDRVERGENDDARVAAIERELEYSQDEDYRLWLQARLDFLRGQKELRPGEVDRFRLNWEKNTTRLETLIKGRATDLETIRATAEDLSTALADGAAALEARRTHLAAITFWLREPSLFSGGSVAAMRAEAVGLWQRAATLPAYVGSVVQEVADSDSAHWKVFAVWAFLVLAFFFGLRLGGRLTAGLMAEPIETLGLGARVGRALVVVYRSAWLAVAVLAAALYTHFRVLDGHPLGLGLVALAVAWVAWGLARGINRAIFKPDADGHVLAGCERRTARGARRVVRTLLVGSGIFFALLLVLRAAGAPRLARVDVFAWGALGVLVGAWLAIRRDVLTVFVPRGGGMLARTIHGVLRITWPVLVLLGGAVLTLGALGYRTATTFYATRALWCALALLTLAFLHAVLRALLHRHLPPLADDDDEDVAAAPERLQLVSRFLGGLLTAVLLAGVAVTLSLVFDLRWTDWERLGGINLTGGEADTGLTLGRLSRAILIFAVSLGLARFLRDVVRSVLRARHVHMGSRYVVRTLLFYTLITIGTLIALAALGVELTQFGWFLTAAGVGIGFGLQEIISNFICGLILFFERPVQVGDVVTVGNVQGDVQQINIRSTVVRTRDGVAIILPNKRLITEDVVNWSHGEQRTRASVEVGVAYGSDVALVRSILLEVAAGEKRILSRPPPEVNFLTFGESQLQFQLMAWLPTPDPTLRRRVITAVNTRIDEVFRARGVEIPFPQRDLHLRSSEIGTLQERDEEHLGA